ncbi:hypothetical protein BDR07DRAFT_1614786 [Suillus spraguei]|nr:hypothetical protein BDR07DRAFT_1614786 [Suillus spraguei]
MSEEFQGLDEAMRKIQLDEVEKLNDNKGGDSGHTTPSEQQPISITLPPPKRNRQVYGFPVSFEWLWETAASLLAEIEPDEENVYGNPIYGFRTYFGISSIGTASAILLPGQIVPAECMDGKFVTVLYIFNEQPHNYRYRPTQEQVDEITEFVGREPQWWLDCMPGSFYDGLTD